MVYFERKGKSTVARTLYVYGFFYPQSQVKSAYLVTYDENGERIPLSERCNAENAENDDIRYSRALNGDEKRAILKSVQSRFSGFVRTANGIEWTNSEKQFVMSNGKSGKIHVAYNDGTISLANVKTYFVLRLDEEIGDVIIDDIRPNVSRRYYEQVGTVRTGFDERIGSNGNGRRGSGLYNDVDNGDRGNRYSSNKLDTGDKAN